MMTEYLKTILTGQFEAALSMLNQCVRFCPPKHYEGTIANHTFRMMAYHTLFYVDYYLSPNEHAFKLRELHHRGGVYDWDLEPFGNLQIPLPPGDDRIAGVPSAGLPKDDTLRYVDICRGKILETMASETTASLEGPSGFSWLAISRGELHVYNIRHIQHHAAQMSAYLRRVDAALKDTTDLHWVRTGW